MRGTQTRGDEAKPRWTCMKLSPKREAKSKLEGGIGVWDNINAEHVLHGSMEMSSSAMSALTMSRIKVLKP